LDVAYTDLSGYDSLVVKLYAKNSSGSAVAIHTAYEGSASYSHIHSTLAPTSGTQGPLGPQGFQGFAGPQGFQGFVGPQGFQGLIGLQGFQGFAGPQGFQGLVGVQGFQGLQGEMSPLAFSFGSGIYFPVNDQFGASFIDASLFNFPFDTSLYQQFTFDIALVMETNSGGAGIDVQYGFGLLKENPSGPPNFIPGYMFNYLQPITSPKTSFGGIRHHLTTRDYFTLNPSSPEIVQGNPCRLLGFISCTTGNSFTITGGRFIWTLTPST
jgi:hypothetical protein